MIGSDTDQWPKEESQSLSTEMPSEVVSCLEILLTFAAMVLSPRYREHLTKQSTAESICHPADQGKTHELRVVNNVRDSPEPETCDDHKEEAQVERPLRAKLLDARQNEPACDELSSC